MQPRTKRDIRKSGEMKHKFWQIHVKACRKSGYRRAEYCQLHDAYSACFIHTPPGKFTDSPVPPGGSWPVLPHSGWRPSVLWGHRRRV